MTSNAFLIAACVLAAIAAVTDARSGTIPNALTLPALFGAPLAHALRARVAGMDGSSVAMEVSASVGGAVLCAVVPLLLYRRSAMGGGDVKLFAALGAILQVMQGVEAQTYAMVLAALLAPGYLAYKGTLFATLKNTGVLMLNAVRPDDKQVPVHADTMTWFRLGPAVFLGTLLTAYLDWSPTR